MNKTRKIRGSVAVLCAASALALTLGTAVQALEITPKMPADAAWMDLLPEDVASKGVLEAATTDGNAPWSFVEPDSGEPVGVDVDLLDEAAKRLGLEVNWSAIQFTAGIPGVQSGRYDTYVSAMADTVTRQEVVNFIDYSEEGSGVIVKKGNPLGIETFDDLCGKTVSIVTGSLFPEFVEGLNENCDTPIVLSETGDQTGPYLAVASRSGRCDHEHLRRFELHADHGDRRHPDPARTLAGSALHSRHAGLRLLQGEDRSDGGDCRRDAVHGRRRHLSGNHGQMGSRSGSARSDHAQPRDVLIG